MLLQASIAAHSFNASCSFIYSQVSEEDHSSIGSDTLLAGQMPQLKHQWYKCGLGSLGHWHIDYSGKQCYARRHVCMSRRLTHICNAVGQVVPNLTHIAVFVSCNQERKHCPAHSLAGWSNGSCQRAGQSRSQCQRTISGEHMHTKHEQRCGPPVCLNDTVSRSPRH